jgi:hypothetical protein
MRSMISLIVAATLIGAPAAIAQTIGTPNSGAGVPFSFGRFTVAF